MSKAEEMAIQHCCAKCVHDKFGCSMKVLHNGRDCIKCGNYIKGYEQAEKDLELTWEDIKLLDKIFMNEKIMSGLILGKKEYEEVLKRFKDLKHVK